MHKDKYSCVRCDSDVETRFAVEIDGQIFCKHCLNEFTNSYSTKSLPKRRISTFCLIALSSIPGANYMYMGLVKKGLAYLILFFSVVMLGSYLHPFVITIPIIYIYCFFDCLEKRRSIHMGISIPDDASELTNFLLRYRLPTIYIVAILLVFDFFRSVNYARTDEYQNFLLAIFSNFFEAIIVLVATIGLFYIVPVCLRGDKLIGEAKEEKEYDNK